MGFNSGFKGLNMYVYFSTDSLSCVLMASYGLFWDDRLNKSEFLENIDIKPDFPN